MYKKIMVPVDLTHVDNLGKAIDTATDLAKLYKIPVCFVGVTAETPTSIAHNPAEYTEKLKAFGEKQAADHGLAIEVLAIPSHDPTVDLDKNLIAAAHDTGADLIVMASHVPGVLKHIFSTQGGQVASHADCSVLLVR
jgi:nucleotide-binding universal stress UspA family protein